MVERRAILGTMIAVGLLMITMSFSETTGMISLRANNGVEMMGSGLLLGVVGMIIVIIAFVIIFAKMLGT